MTGSRGQNVKDREVIMQFPDSWFEDEVREGFFIAGMMKRAWAAQLQVLSDVGEVGKGASSGVYSLG